jgi:hypothetical protein
MPTGVPKNVNIDFKNQPITEGAEKRGGLNTNPSAALSRPAPPQPYKPNSNSSTGSKSSGSLCAYNFHARLQGADLTVFILKNKPHKLGRSCAQRSKADGRYHPYAK